MDQVKRTGPKPLGKSARLLVLCGAKVLAVIAAYSLFVCFLGYRLTPLQAAKADTHIPDNADLVEEIDMACGRCFLLKKADQFFLAGCRREGLLWRCGLSGSADNRPDDGLMTLAYFGWGSHEKGDTVFAVQTSDPQVAYIEAGKGSERVRRPAMVGTPIVFQWAHTEIWLDDLAAHALDADGRLLYEYRFAEKGADGSEHLWCPVNDPSEAWYPVDKPSTAS